MPRNSNFSFWLEPSAWPNLARHRFLAETVDAIGRAMFADQWTGREVITDTISPKEKKAAEEAREKRVAEAKRAASIQFGGPPGRPIPRFVIEELERQRNAAAQLSPYDERSLERLASVQTEIARQAEKGILKTVMRPLTGGRAFPIPPEWWATERLAPRFALCRINPSDPFSREASEATTSFVTENSLFTVIRSLTTPSEQEPVLRRRPGRKPGQGSFEEVDSRW